MSGELEVMQKPEFSNVPDVRPSGYGLVSVDEQRAIAEVRASMQLAKMFPRNEAASVEKIRQACQRPTLADAALYAYPRGGQTVTGPSIRLAEVVANAWGNVEYGYREIGSGQDFTEVEAFCFDKETNTRSTCTFRVAHKRKAAGSIKTLSDPRDIYELVANQASRRVRARILQVIPGDVVEYAVSECESTMKSGKEPIADRVRKMIGAFSDIGVPVESLEKRLGHKMAAVIEQELVSLRKIYTSIKDGASAREDWFTDLAPAASDDINAKLDAMDEPATKQTKADLTPRPEPAKEPSKRPPTPDEQAALKNIGKAAPPSKVTCPNTGKEVVTAVVCPVCPSKDGCPELLP